MEEKTRFFDTLYREPSSEEEENAAVALKPPESSFTTRLTVDDESIPKNPPTTTPQWTSKAIVAPLHRTNSSSYSSSHFTNSEMPSKIDRKVSDSRRSTKGKATTKRKREGKLRDIPESLQLFLGKVFCVFLSAENK